MSVSPRLFDRLLSMLVYEKIQINRERGNAGAGRSVCFGIVGKRSAPSGPSRWNDKRPEVWAELQEIAKSLPVPAGWSSCVCNMDFACLPHYDSGNSGNSMIVSFGCYSGGELVMDGVETDTYLKPVVADFSKIKHYVKPLSGLKFSLVYFTHDPAAPKSRIKQTQLSAEDVISYVDPSHMFNPLPAVSRGNGNSRSYVDVVTPNPAWSGINNPSLLSSSST